MNKENFKKVVMFEMLMRRAFGPPYNEPQQMQVLNSYRNFLTTHKDNNKRIDVYERHAHNVISNLSIAIQQFMEWPIRDVEKEELGELLNGLDNPSCEGEIYYVIDELLVLTDRLKRISPVLRAA